MKLFITYIFLICSLYSFTQNKSQKQLKDSVFTEKINTYTLQNMMLYPVHSNNVIVQPTNNDYSFQTNNTTTMKVANIVGVTLKSLVVTKGINVSSFEDPKPKNYNTTDD